MTKFAKGILTTGILLTVGVGGYKLYEYAKEEGWIDKLKNSHLPEKTRAEIEDFINEESNIGFLQYNYDILNVNKLDEDLIHNLLSNPYEMSDDGILSNPGISKTQLFKDYEGTIRENLRDPQVCFKTSIVKEVIHKLTAQTLDYDKSKVCVPSITRSNIQYVHAQVKNVKMENKRYVVSYTLTPVSNYFYVQDNKYEGLNIYDEFDGTLTLGKAEDDGRYIYLSNTFVKGTPLYK